MNTMDLVRFVGRAQSRPPRRSSAPLFYTELAGPTRQAILRARQRLISEQRDDGSWVGTQTSDASLPSQLIFLHTYLDEDSPTTQLAANAILRMQLASGGWSRTFDGEADISVSVQAYLALKLTGIDASDCRLRRARMLIHAMGGADAADATTRRYLALFGQVSYDECPPAVPESVLLSRRTNSNDAALALIWAQHSVHDVGFERGVRELFISKPHLWPPATDRPKGVRSRYINGIASKSLAAVVRFCERRGWLPLRSRALNAAEAYVGENLSEVSIHDMSFSDLAWHAIAIRAIGHELDNDVVARCRQRVESMIHVDELLFEALPLVRMSALNDTLSALQSLAASGLKPSYRSMKLGAKHLARSRRNRPQLPLAVIAQLLQLISNSVDPNDTDDTTLPPQIGVELWPVGAGLGEKHSNKLLDRSRKLADMLVTRIVGCQKQNGGWGTISQTAVVLEAIATATCNSTQSAIDGAIHFLRAAQYADGRWSDEPPTQEIFATTASVCGLAAAGVSCDDDTVAAGLNWVAAQQQSNGCWATCKSVTCTLSNEEGDADSGLTPSIARTAAALLAFVAAGQPHHPSALRAVCFLLDSQSEDGGWRDLDFPLHDESVGQWLRNDLHTITSPLLALSRWIVAAASTQSEMAESMTLRLVGAVANN